jgi:preprotein translocase subunit SecA
MVKEFSEEVCRDIAATHVEEKSDPSEWDFKSINDACLIQFGVGFTSGDTNGAATRDELAEAIAAKAWKSYEEKLSAVGDEPFAQFEKVIMLHTLDTLWKDHLLSMDHLKGGIGLRGYGQKNPLQEYKKEGYDMFVDMIARLKSEVCERLFKVQIKREEETGEVPAPKQQHVRPQKVTYSRGEEPEEEAKEQPAVRFGDKVGRNDPCPCGSGLKYKRCCAEKSVR